MKKSVLINRIIKPFNKKIEVTSDKSISIRCVLLASQAIGTSKIYNLLESEDVINSLLAIKKLGINYKKFKNFYEIYGYGINGFYPKKNARINAGNSGTLSRLILGLLINIRNKVYIVGDASLSKRDFSRVTEPLKSFGANIVSKNNTLPLSILGSEFLSPINFKEKLGSAQSKSSVMLAALKTPGTTIIKAKKSRDHTELLFKYLKVPISIKREQKYDLIKVDGPFNFKGFNYKVPGDISSCSFFLVLTLLSKNSKICIKNVNINKTRIGIVNILNRMNAKILFKNRRSYNGEIIGDIFVKSETNLKAIKCPKSLNSYAIDEFLIIFLVAAKAKGISSFSNLGELNKKESPRLEVALKFLKMIGVNFLRSGDDIKIYGRPDLNLNGNYTMKNFRKDHRVFMMSCIAALTFGGTWKIHDKDSIKTSFPNFIKKIKSLGAKVY
ncbi:3-phosphoshikimate 1-carboxyvinyltransferase [Candidatus Pelagibacter sp.]|nr:3-phosphoshikimate 1-carboxyvinyltransferase [Candidatus Pelagibacter sp.]